MHPLIAAWLINTLLFAILLLTTCPVYLSGDDLNIMQTLAGGYDGQPASCLPFYYNAHYFINVPLKYLYGHFPSVNWYGLWLLVLQYLSGIAICYVLLQRKRFGEALLLYGLFFLVFGAGLLLYINQSSTSVLCTLAALLLLWESLAGRQVQWKLFSVGILVLIAGALARFHTLLPVMVVAAPFLLLLRGRRRQLFAVTTLVATLGICWLLYQQQYNHYARNCPGWVQEEQYRQAKYANINYHKDQQALQQTPHALEAAMLKELLLFDTSFPDKATLHTLARSTNGPATAREVLSQDGWYWNFINHRLLLAAVALTVILCCTHRAMPAAAWVALLVALAGIGYMQVFRKVPAYFIPGVLMTFTAFALHQLSYRGYRHSYARIAWALVLTGVASWALVRIVKTSQHNRQQFQLFMDGYKELAASRDNLFIQIDQDGRYAHFYCLANPSQYGFENILFLDHPVSARATALRNAFGVDDIRKAPLYNHVYFVGKPSDTLLQYYERVLGRSLHYSDPLPGYQFVEVRQIIVEP